MSSVKDQIVKILRRRYNDARDGGQLNAIAYKKAADSVQAFDGEINSIEDLSGIKFIGENIRRFLENSGVFDHLAPAAAPVAAAPPPNPPLLPPPPVVPVIPIEFLQSWSVAAWLNSINLRNYTDSFINAGYDNFLAVKDLTEYDLEAIGIELPGHRKTLLLHSRMLAAQTPPPPPLPAAAVSHSHAAQPAPRAPASRAPAPPPLAAAGGGSIAAQASQPLVAGCRITRVVERSALVPVLSASFVLRNAQSDAHVRKALAMYSRVDVAVNNHVFASEIKADVSTPEVRVTATLTIAEGAITKCSCNCAKWSGSMCKHIILALLTLDSPLASSLHQHFHKQAPPSPSIIAPPAAALAHSHPPLPVAVAAAKGANANNQPPPPKPPRRYVPRRRTGPWAILYCLYVTSVMRLLQFNHDLGRFQNREQHPHGLTKEQLVALAQPLSDTPMLPAEGSGSSYSAWSGMKTLVEKQLVVKIGRPVRHQLTGAGRDLGAQIAATESAGSELLADLIEPSGHNPRDDEDCPAADDYADEHASQQPHKRRSNEPTSAPPLRRVRSKSPSPPPPLPEGDTATAAQRYLSSAELTGEASLVLLIDNREHKRNKTLYEKFVELHPDIECQSRSLELGDVAWVLRINQTEYVLDCIMERKTLIDLEASMIDKRYQEQKFRMVRSGLRGLVYLIEGPMPLGKCEAIINDLVDTHLEGFVVHRTERLDDTIAYIYRAHVSFFARLQADSFTGLVLSQQYQDFARRVSKNKNATLTIIFAKMLMQIRGCTPEHAASITAVFPTCRSLLNRLDCDSVQNVQNYIAALKSQSGRKVGPAVAQQIVLMMRTEDPSLRLRSEET